jgi:hypothetical protein
MHYEGKNCPHHDALNRLPTPGDNWYLGMQTTGFAIDRSSITTNQELPCDRCRNEYRDRATRLRGFQHARPENARRGVG